MKKIYKIIIGISVCLVLIGLTIFIIIPRNRVTYKIVSVPYEYFITEEDNIQKLEIPIFINQQHNEYMKKEHILNAYFTQAYNDDKFKVVIDNIIEKDMVVNNDEEYYQYNIDLLIPFSSDELILLNELYLNMEYTNLEHLSFPIGSIAVIPRMEARIGYSSLKGLVRKINDEACLCGVLIKLKNEEDFKINKITPISNNAQVVNDYTRFVVNEEDVDQYLPDNYNPYDVEISLDELNITNNSDYLFISLGYKKEQITTSLGFIIDYTVGDIEYKSIIHPFRYFQTDKIYQSEETIYEVPNYK